MMKAVARIGRKKSPRPFKEFYQEWIEILKNTLYPLLCRSMLVSSANLLSTHVQMLHHHFQAYYQVLDLVASDNISQLLYPNWRNSLEKPFLWFGDFHPYLFTNLLRSFFKDDFEDDCDRKKIDKPLMFSMAWEHPSEALMSRIEQIECGLRLMVPSIMTRSRRTQSLFIDRVAVDWIRCEGRQEALKSIGGAMVGQMDELVSIFLDANRLRRSILTEIMGVTDVYQAALYLEGLSQFYIGFRDTELLREFEHCNMPLSLNP